MKELAHIVLKPEDGFLTDLYHQYVVDYPKFFKMDILCRLGFVATEMLLQKEGVTRFVPRDDRAIVMAGRFGSIVNDRAYEQTIQPENYYPSPSLFVYTLPNIVTAEIAIRNKYLGETMYYALPDESTLLPLIESTLTGKTTSVLGGWIDVQDNEHYIANISIWTN